MPPRQRVTSMTTTKSPVTKVEIPNASSMIRLYNSGWKKIENEYVYIIDLGGELPLVLTVG